MDTILSPFLRSRTVCLLAISLFPAATAAAQNTVPIHEVMTKLPGGPYLGQNISTSGIVVGVMRTGGFYISEASANWDSDPATAEGMPVFSSSVTACNSVAEGDVVTVVGTVVNATAPDTAKTPGTGIEPTSCVRTGTGVLTQSIDLANAGPWTRFGEALPSTGMPVTGSPLVAIASTAGSQAAGATASSNAAAVTSTGQFWGVPSSGMTTNHHLFRQPGIAKDEDTPVGAPGGVPAWSGNPQRVLIDTTAFGGTAVDMAAGQTLTCRNTNTTGRGATAGIGLIDYTLGYARLLIFRETTCNVSGGAATPVRAAAAMSAPDATHFKVGTLDMNTVPGGAATFHTTMAKATLAVTNTFGSPDIFALQEAGDQATLAQLATAVNTANAGTTQYAATVPGTDTVNNGFLINTRTVKNAMFTEAGRGTTYTATDGSSAALWDHPPLVLTGEFARVGKNYPVTVINVHMTPRDNTNDAAPGADIRKRRAAQAAAVSTMVDRYQKAGANVIVAGNLNSYEYNDGYVDVVGVIDGSPAPAAAVTLYQPSHTAAALTDFTTRVASDTRYNAIEHGNAATLEHILASSTVTDPSIAAASLASAARVVTQPHFSTDYPAVTANDAATPAGLTPHDGFLVEFAVPPVPATATLSPTSNSFGNVIVGSTSSIQNFVWTNTSSMALTVQAVNVTGDFSVASTTCGGSVAAGGSCLIAVVFQPAALKTRTGILIVNFASSVDGTPTVPNEALTASLSGVGVADVQANADAVSFGNGDVGASSAAQTLTLTNYTNASIALTGLTVRGDFGASTTCGGTLGGHMSCTVAVAFTPTATGARTGALVVTTGDTRYPAITVALTGNGVDFSLTVSPASGRTIAGYAIAPVVTATAMGGFNAPVTFGCSTKAAGSICEYALLSTTLTGVTQNTVTIATTSRYTVVGYGALLAGPGNRGWLGMLLGTMGAAVLLAGRKRAQVGARLMLALLGIGLVTGAMAGCGGKLPDRNSPYTEPGTYDYTLTATDGTITRSATYSLTVTAK